MHSKIQGHRSFGSREEVFFLSFNHIWAWRPSWSCDQEHLSKISFRHPIEAPYEIWLWLAQWFLRRRCLKSVDDDGRRTTEAYLPYKLTKWAFGSGELIKVYTYQESVSATCDCLYGPCSFTSSEPLPSVPVQSEINNKGNFELKIFKKKKKIL